MYVSISCGSKEAVLGHELCLLVGAPGSWQAVIQSDYDPELAVKRVSATLSAGGYRGAPAGGET
jgi:hypothetical protein